MDFVEPPPLKKRGNSQHWMNVVNELKANPGKWGLVGNYSVGVSTHIKNGRYPSFYPPGTDDPAAYVQAHWEVTTRSTGGSRVDVYVRWVGEA